MSLSYAETDTSFAMSEAPVAAAAKEMGNLAGGTLAGTPLVCAPLWVFLPFLYVVFLGFISMSMTQFIYLAANFFLWILFFRIAHIIHSHDFLSFFLFRLVQLRITASLDHH